MLCFLLLDESGDGEHILADLSAELGCAFHDKLALLRGVKHIVKTEQDAQRAVERIEAKGEERHSSLVNASAGSRFARLYAQISRKLVVAVDSPRIDTVGALERPIVNIGMAELVELADAARKQIEVALDEQSLGVLVLRDALCRKQRGHLQQHCHERGEQAGMLCNTLHLGQGCEAHLALEECVHRLDALELKLDVGSGVHLVVVNEPLAAVDYEMGSHLAVRAVGIESTDLHNAVRVLKLLCKRGNVACNYLDERKDSVEKKFISKNLIS